MDVDAVGYPKRYKGDRYKYNGRIFTIIENRGLLVLCPCPDTLIIRYDDNDDDGVIENSNQFEKIN